MHIYVLYLASFEQLMTLNRMYVYMYRKHVYMYRKHVGVPWLCIYLCNNVQREHVGYVVKWCSQNLLSIIPSHNCSKQHNVQVLRQEKYANHRP